MAMDELSRKGSMGFNSGEPTHQLLQPRTPEEAATNEKAGYLPPLPQADRVRDLGDVNLVWPPEAGEGWDG